MQVNRVNPKTYTVADLYAEASKLVKSEMGQLKNRPLSPAEEAKSAELARAISQLVLKEMKIA